MIAVIREIATEGRGKAAPYRISPAERGHFDLMAFWVEAQSGKRPGRYKVRQDAMGWWCSCADARYGAVKHRRKCKHVKAVREMAEYSEVIMAAKNGRGTDEAKPQAAAKPGLRDLLREPFHPDEVKWKPQAVKGNRAMAVAYVDARAVMDRLDDVLGVSGWQDSYEYLPDGAVTCRLRVRQGDEWIEKEDVGSPSEQPDGHDRRKAAVSDALKRAAVKYGIGRYLYHLPRQWVDYDPARKVLLRKPTLPDWAIPGAKVLPPPPPEPEPPPAEEPSVSQEAGNRPASTAVDRTPTVWDDVLKFETALVARGLCQPGELSQSISTDEAITFAWGDAPQEWIEAAREDVRAYCKVFNGRCKARKNTAAMVR